MAWFPITPDLSATGGALVKAESYVPAHAGTLAYINADDIDAALRRVNENGGKALRGKVSIGQCGLMRHFEDCEGNRVALHSK